MNRKRLESEMIKMGFHGTNNGFRYIIDAVELIIEEPFTFKVMWLYESIAKKNNSTRSRVERAMRHAIISMYNRLDNASSIYAELAPDPDKGHLPNSEFVARLAMLAKERQW